MGSGAGPAAGLPRAPGAPSPVLAVLWGLAALGCAAFGPTALDVPPGHRAVLGRVELTLPDATQGTLDIVKEDRTFAVGLTVTAGQPGFAVTLPPGRYRIVRLRAVGDRQSYSNPIWDLRATFEVGPEPAVYIGTLRIVATSGLAVRVTVDDEYDDTLRALRRLYSDLPGVVARRLLSPS